MIRSQKKFDVIMIRKYLLMILLPVTLLAQSQFKVDFDYASFPTNQGYSQVEFYYSFLKNSLTQVEENGVISVAGNLQIEIKDSSRSNTLVKDDYKFNSDLDDANYFKEQKLTGAVKYFLSPGEYFCILKGYDLNDEQIFDSTVFSLSIPNFDSTKVMLSDIQLANTIQQNSVDENSPFFKNTLEVVPNPSSLYGLGLPVMYFYYEIHNVDKQVQTEFLRVSYELLNSSGVAVYSKQKFMPRTNSSLVDIGAIKVNEYFTGQYNFKVIVEDSLSGISDEAIKKLFIYNPEKLDSTQIILGDASYLSSSYITMSMEELDKEFDEARYISTQLEKEKWSKLTTLEAKREFLFEYWKNRDSNTSTAINETKVEYNKRIVYSRENFSDLSQKEGWKTDRGRVYVLYGSPSEIERYPYGSETIPYEIWRYENIEGGAIFVFADYSGFNNYQLLHSTKRGELKDDRWSDKIAR